MSEWRLPGYQKRLYSGLIYAGLPSITTAPWLVAPGILMKQNPPIQVHLSRPPKPLLRLLSRFHLHTIVYNYMPLLYEVKMAFPPAVVFAVLSLPLIFSLFYPGPFLSSVSQLSILSLTRTENFVCTPSAYRTEIVSLDPLVIYIHSFLRPEEIDSILTTAEPLFKPSQVYKYGRMVDTADRTSSTAGLPLDDPAVQCVLDRARNFMGTIMVDGKDEMGPPQLVRYTSGQKFNIHHDFYQAPQWAYDGSQRKFNRVASFFVILQDNCTDGETYFPYITTPANGSLTKSNPFWREHEDGGIAFRPIKANALFWMNLHANGTGDRRTMHAGLPVEEGLKTAMNIWPRQFYAID